MLSLSRLSPIGPCPSLLPLSQPARVTTWRHCLSPCGCSASCRGASVRRHASPAAAPISFALNFVISPFSLDARARQPLRPISASSCDFVPGPPASRVGNPVRAMRCGVVLERATRPVACVNAVGCREHERSSCIRSVQRGTSSFLLHVHHLHAAMSYRARWEVHDRACPLSCLHICPGRASRGDELRTFFTASRMPHRT